MLYAWIGPAATGGYSSFTKEHDMALKRCTISAFHDSMRYRTWQSNLDPMTIVKAPPTAGRRKKVKPSVDIRPIVKIIKKWESSNVIWLLSNERQGGPNGKRPEARVYNTASERGRVGKT